MYMLLRASRRRGTQSFSSIRYFSSQNHARAIVTTASINRTLEENSQPLPEHQNLVQPTLLQKFYNGFIWRSEKKDDDDGEGKGRKIPSAFEKLLRRTKKGIKHEDKGESKEGKETKEEDEEKKGSQKEEEEDDPSF